MENLKQREKNILPQKLAKKLIISILFATKDPEIPIDIKSSSENILCVYRLFFSYKYNIITYQHSLARLNCQHIYKYLEFLYNCIP